MAKMSAPKAPSVNAKAGGGIPGSSSRARINEAAGQKVVAPTATPAPVQKRLGSQDTAVATGSDLVMPVDHPSAVTTRKTTKGGTL